MTLNQANALIKSCAEQMNARYGKVVFDEWAIISTLDKKGKILTYTGPRKDEFQKHFAAAPILPRHLVGQGQRRVGHRWDRSVRKDERGVIGPPDFAAHLLQHRQEKVTTARGAEQRLAPITTASNEM